MQDLYLYALLLAKIIMRRLEVLHLDRLRLSVQRGTMAIIGPDLGRAAEAAQSVREPHAALWR